MDIEIYAAHFDDDGGFQRELAKALLPLGIKIVLNATSVTDAQRLISEFSKNKVRLAILDGNMGTGRAGCADGLELASHIKQQYPDVLTVGLSGGLFPVQDDMDFVASKMDVPGKQDKLAGLVAEMKARICK